MDIGSINSSMFSSMQSMRGKMDPAEKFKQLDTDGNGGLSKAEMDVMANKIQSITGQAINTEEAMKSHDANGDGLLSQDEMGSLMFELQQKMGPPSGMMGGMNSQRATQAYMNVAGEDQVSVLLDLLDNHKGDLEIEDKGVDTFLKA